MLNPDLRELLKNKTSRYSLVTAVAKRARVVSETPELNESPLPMHLTNSFQASLKLLNLKKSETYK